MKADANGALREKTGLGVEPVPIEPCVSAEYFELERERVFRRCWLNVGRIEELPESGCWVEKQIHPLRLSLILVRTPGGAVRCFHNMCVHRGNKLCLEATGGRAKGFVCGFHGWTYDLEGRLVHVPDRELFPGLDPAKQQLAPVAVEIFSGFIFVNLDTTPSQTLQEYLGSLGEQLADYPFHEFSPAGTYLFDLKANWKTFADAFQETYHVAFIHRRSLPEALTSKGTRFLRFTSFRTHGPHHSISIPANPDYQPFPIEAAMFQHFHSFFLGAGTQLTGVNPENDENWAFDINVIFPNTMLFTMGSMYLRYNFWPIAVDRTRWEVNVCLPIPRRASDHVFREFAKIRLFRDVSREDLNTVEATDEMLRSGARQVLLLSDQEIAVRHLHKAVDDMVTSS